MIKAADYYYYYDWDDGCCSSSKERMDTSWRDSGPAAVSREEYWQQVEGMGRRGEGRERIEERKPNGEFREQKSVPE